MAKYRVPAVAVLLLIIEGSQAVAQNVTGEPEVRQLGIEITIPGSDRPAFYVPSKPAGAKPMFALVPPVNKSRKTGENKPLYIKVASFLEKDKLQVKVSVFYGKPGKIEAVDQLKSMDEEVVGNFVMVEGDSVIVDKLGDIGLQPIKVTAISKLVRKAGREENGANDTDGPAQKLRRKGVEIIKDAASAASSLEDRRSAIRIIGKAADALWGIDETYSRQMFIKAFDDAIEYHSEIKDDGLERVTRNLYMSHPDIRLEIIRLVGRRDAKLSQELVDRYAEIKVDEEERRRQMANSKVKYDSAFGQVDASAGDLLHLTEQLLEIDKKAAFELGRRAFAKGIPQAGGYFFTMLAEKNRPAADQLYSMALDRLSQEISPVPGQLLLLSAYPFGDSQVWISSGDGVNSFRFSVSKDFSLNQSLIDHFFSVSTHVLTRLIEADLSQFGDASSRLGAALFAAKVIEPKIAQFRPELRETWAALTARLLGKVSDVKLRENVESNFQTVSQESGSGKSQSSKDKIQRLLDAAQKTSDLNKRDGLYQEAAFEADLIDDTDQALNIAGRISSLDLRGKTKNWINFNAASKAIKNRRLDEARRYAIEVDATDERAYLFFEMARVAFSEDKGRVPVLLEEALQRSLGADNTADKLRALLGIASLYLKVDHERAFQVAMDAITTANKILQYGPEQARLVRKFDSQSGKNSKVVINESQDLDLGVVLSNLASKDFDRALTLARSLDNQSLRLMSLISISSSLLAKSK
jgi:hypothetical protein